MSLTAIQTTFEKEEEASRVTLNEALDMNLREVIVIGTGQDGLIHIKATVGKNAQDKIGALEFAKLEIFKNWD